MRERLEGFMLVLAVGAAVAIAAKRIGAPYNVALVVIGLLLVFANVLPHAAMDPDVVLLAFLPLLVFESALFADARGLQFGRAAHPRSLPAGGRAVAARNGRRRDVRATPSLSVALLLGALLAITDTVSVLLAFRSTRVPPRLAAIMEGESLFNDGTALVLVSIASTVVVTGNFEIASMTRSLFLAIVGGIASGVAFGAIGSAALRRAPDHLTGILASTVLVFATSLIAERLHASPVIAVVIVGLMVGREAQRALEPSRVLALQGFWEVVGFAVNVLLFLLVGMQIDARMLVSEAWPILLALVALHAGRAGRGVWLLLRAARVPARYRPRCAGST